MHIIYFLLYNFIFWPTFFVFSHLLALFNRKLRNGILGRYRIYKDLRKSALLDDPAKKIVVHCASMGEFEHIKPFLIKLKKEKPDYKIIVLFFSPSGFDNVKEFEATDLFTYAPFDWIWPVLRFMKMVNPAIWIIAKHDVWPNQVWLCKLLKIPVFLINASLHKESSRIRGITKNFHRHIYRHFSNILTISQSDKETFKHIADSQNIIVAGDTKYDQVISRREESRSLEYIPAAALKNKWVFVAGSSWPEDEQHLFPALKKLMEEHPHFLPIICPHEPTRTHIEQIKKNLEDTSLILLSNISNYAGEKIIVIDRIGVLANLYSQAKAAYVGGSFKQNIHNVLEPAVYHIPVIFGPVNSNSHEAQLLKAAGAVEVLDSEKINETLNKWIVDESKRKVTGNACGNIVEKNCGATQSTIQTILSKTEE